MSKFDEISLDDLDRVVGGADGDKCGCGTGKGGNGLMREIKEVVHAVEGFVKSIWPF